ncbi:hypothetical protein C1646_822790 [Rhizophagus diaphanus]|nr:hypothetical protein C1646_822790 [Rhizophagus diaphanus] [Rhizophagus sp. MUCL 43196]
MSSNTTTTQGITITKTSDTRPDNSTPSGPPTQSDYAGISASNLDLSEGPATVTINRTDGSTATYEVSQSDSRAYSKLIHAHNSVGGSEEYIRIIVAIGPLSGRHDHETPEMWCSLYATP